MRDNDVPPGKSENSIESNQENPDREHSILHKENQIEKDLKKVEQEDQIIVDENLRRNETIHEDEIEDQHPEML